MVSVFFDLDGLLVNFVKGVLKVHNRQDMRIDDVRWGLEDQLKIDPPKFWAPMGFEFWRDLERNEDGINLLSKIQQVVGEKAIGILTSPCQTPGCRDGKAEWVKRWLPQYSSRLFMGSAKELFAGPTKILLDDRNENAWSWRAAGGQPVLIPRPWNGLAHQTYIGGAFNVDSVFDIFLANYRVACQAEKDDAFARNPQNPAA